jgi:hypothetical protein
MFDVALDLTTRVSDPSPFHRQRDDFIDLSKTKYKITFVPSGRRYPKEMCFFKVSKLARLFWYKYC